jgi:hypothetical protein
MSHLPKPEPRKYQHLNEIMTALLSLPRRSAGRQGFAISETPDQLTHGAPALIVVKPN